jgi:hypothetical protein
MGCHRSIGANGTASKHLVRRTLGPWSGRLHPRVRRICAVPALRLYYLVEVRISSHFLHLLKELIEHKTVK